MSIERFLLVNQLMDFAIMAASARALGRFRLGRVLTGSAIAALIPLLPPGMRTAPAQLAMLALLGAWLSGRLSPLTALSACAAMVVCASAAGTLARFFAERGAGMTAGIAAGIGAALLSMRCIRLRRAENLLEPLQLVVTSNGRAVRLDAIIDTGNRLREPLSGQPVMIASGPRLRGVIPNSGLRAVAYGAVGGSGTLECFRPDRIEIVRCSRLRRAPDAWIAVYPGRLPGGHEALAPAEFA